MKQNKKAVSEPDSKHLVIVESPTKAKTISRFLGSNFHVVSSKGHIVDLPQRRLGINIEEGFAPEYKVIKGKAAFVKELRREAKNKDRIYLATDPDREGEAISWHLRNQLASIPDDRFLRVIFHEITLDAIDDAFQNPLKLDIHKVEAQKARRVLDRIVGYYLSPLLWRKIARGLSAGRVQSVALRFIIEREKEIEKFIPVKTWSIDGLFSTMDGSFTFEATLDKYEDTKLVISAPEEADRILSGLQDKKFLVKDFSTRENNRMPQPPFITSTLQQDAFNKFHFSSTKTMMIAQKLYEGIELPEGMVGLITYMRTDSVNVAEKAVSSARMFIKTKWGDQYIPAVPHKYKNKKQSQEAHEAIRPADITKEPESLVSYLSEDEYKVYTLIYKRFVASQMRPAVFKRYKLIIEADRYLFNAEGQELIFDGFLKLYPEGYSSQPFRDFKPQEEVRPMRLEKLEHISKPPPRYSDASLIKLLEEKNIGRPSTYAPTIGTLLYRDYVRRQRGYLFPTPLGVAVIELLVGSFDDLINEKFTADMEDLLDNVEEGTVKWNDVLLMFYPHFKTEVEKAAQDVQKKEMFVGEECPLCKNPLVVKWSRKGRFISCSTFPACKFAKPFSTNVKCPSCEGQLVERRNKRGQVFYGCSRYPECTFTSRRLPEEKKTAPESGEPAKEEMPGIQDPTEQGGDTPRDQQT